MLLVCRVHKIPPMKKESQKNEVASSLPSRRKFVAQSATTVGAAIAATLPISRSAWAAGSDEIKIGLVGCGGRGSGAAAQALRADDGNKLVAVADAFEDRLNIGLSTLQKQPDIKDRVVVDSEKQFVGFDAYQRVIDSGVDVVLLATPPHFRPMQLRACIEAGKHVFAEKPVAVDGPGVRSVLETTELAKQKGLYIVSGLNTRYSGKAQEFMKRIHEGAIGDIVTMHAARYANGVWTRARQPGMSEMEYQMRNWYYFTWLSGDFNVEQFVHQLDQMAWANGGKYPERCYGTGGRQVRTGPDHGHIYDHFETTFDYGNNLRAFAGTRHWKGCMPESGTYITGTKGTASMTRRKIAIEGENPWEAPRDRKEIDSHQLEHDDFFAALRSGTVINNGEYMAKSTLMAIMARMTAYTGKNLTWEEALNSKEALVPSAYTWEGTPPEAKVAVPGVTKFI